ncbi:MAG: FTR1 family iron permease, partial [Clostridium sp.]|nr:FTR1 family iron permease [Clostridium sp.]
EVELAFTTLRKAVKKDQGVDAVRAAADKLVGFLREDGAILSPEGAGKAAEASGADAETGTEGPVFTDYYLTLDEFKEGYGVTDLNYNDLALVIKSVADHAVELYKAGDKEQAYEFAKATYWGYYETSGFERNTMSYISGSRVSEVELAFTTLRKSIKKDQGPEAAQAAADHLSELLIEDGLKLSPEGPTPGFLGSGEAAAENAETAAAQTEVKKSGTSVGSGIAVFLGSFAIILREGLEAILIVGAIIAYLIKSGNKEGVRPVYIGSAFAVVCSFIMAGILNHLLSKSAEYHMSQEIIEGIAALTAVCVLFWVSNWMVSKAESAAWTKYIEGKVAGSASQGNLFALGFTAWLAVFREGAEVILFYQPMLREDHPEMVWAGFITGCIVLVFVFLAIRYLSIRLPLKPFFMGTSILMAAMAISFLGAGIKELMEGGVLDNFELALSSPPWLSWIPYNDTLDVLGIYPLVGTIVPQLILLAITIVTFVMHIREGRKIAAEAAEKAAPAGKAAPAEKPAAEAQKMPEAQESAGSVPKQN